MRSAPREPTPRFSLSLKATLGPAEFGHLLDKGGTGLNSRASLFFGGPFAQRDVAVSCQLPEFSPPALSTKVHKGEVMGTGKLQVSAIKVARSAKGELRPLRNRQAGFSLIELLIVVAIILVIAAIAIPNLLRSRLAANESSSVATLRAINTSEIVYSTAYGSFFSKPGRPGTQWHHLRDSSSYCHCGLPGGRCSWARSRG